MGKVIFIDCGGNVGQSVQYALENYEDVEVHTFEGYSVNVDCIREKYGDDERVHIYHNVIYKEAKEMKFYLQDWGARTGSSIIKEKKSVDKNKVEIVQSIDLGEWITSNFSKDDEIILKIDIEGAEYEVIEHLMDTRVDDYINHWFVEWHKAGKLVNVNSDYIDRVRTRFDDAGYNFTDWSFHYDG